MDHLLRETDSREEFFECGGAIFEDSPEVRVDEKSIDEDADRNSVLDFVAHECAAVFLLKHVLVMPVAVRAFYLII